MKILMISPKAQGEGGIAGHVSTLARKLAEMGHEVTVLSCTGTEGEVKDLKVSCSSRKGLANLSFMAKASLKVSNDYDVVHGHNAPSVIPLALSRGKRKVMTIHGPYSEQVPRKLKWGAKLLEWLTFRVADVVTVVSKTTQRWYESRGYHTVYVPNAIDPDDFLDVRGERLFDTQVVYVGRMSPEKGVDLLVKAIPKFKDVGFLLVGGGPLLGLIRRELEGLKNVVITGRVSRKKALQYIKGSDLLVLPSRSEGLSTVLLEAGYLGVPIVASSIEGNKEVSDGHAYFFDLEPGREVDNLVEAIRRALKGEEEVAERLRERVLKNYTWEVALQGYLRVYDVVDQES